ncbi:MAG: choice-of-anchor L domain-containing protein, partial [Bacteroidales bacterium]|nr:choice-of-anchor L domain-containing protein [Bacteroidales bacterium]
MVEILVGGGVEVSNISYTGHANSSGKFWGGPGNIGIRDGIILTSGDANIAKGPNNSGSAGWSAGTPGDPDLTSISGVNTFDACVLEFDFVPQSTVVSFRYVFGSEEYHEYVNQYNDAFGFFISGPGISGPFSNNSKNIALIPLSNTPVSINTVNYGNPYGSQCTNCVFFVNNVLNFTQYDAFTTVLTAWANVIPCETYHIKLAIADGVDRIYDSGVFLEANSFSSVGIASDVMYTHAPTHNHLIEGCNDATITFTLSVQPAEDYHLPLIIEGSAINGVDYELIPDTIVFPAGYSQVSLDIITIADDITEWFETIRIVYNSSLCSIDYDTILMNLWDYRLSVQTTPDTTINCATPATIGVKNINGFGPYSISWSTGETTEYITVSPPITTTYYVTVAALCDSMITDSIRVVVNGPKANAGQDLSIPHGTDTQLQGSASQGSGEFTYSWSPADMLIDPTSATPTTVQMEQTTQFTLIVTDLAGGCQDIDQMMLFVTGGPLNTGPVASPPAICYGATSHLYSYASGGSENYTYQWSSVLPGFDSDLPDPIVQPTVTTTYYVLVNDGYNAVTGNVTVEVIPLPIPNAGEDQTINWGTYTTLYGSGSQGSGNYVWSWEPINKVLGTYLQNTPTVKLYETTLFSLSITDQNTGCVCADKDFVTVFIGSGPLAVTADASESFICEGETTQLFALPSGGNPEYTYSWTSNPAGFVSNIRDPFVSPVSTTTYDVEVYDGYNYTYATVTIEVSPQPQVNLGADIITCPFETIELRLDMPGMSYYWSNGSVENSITVGSTGIGFDIRQIWVEVTNQDGCVGTDTIQIVFDFAQCSGVGESNDD